MRTDRWAHAAACLVAAGLAAGCRSTPPSAGPETVREAPANVADVPEAPVVDATMPLPEAEPPATVDAEPDPWHEPVAEREPATDAAQKVKETLDGIASSLTETRYQYVTVVSERRGIYKWDCSGMAAWVLGRTAPRALTALHSERPLARDFHDVIADSPTDEARRGWQRLETIDSVSPGDLFAWLKPEFWADRPNTGHVGFVVGTPQPHPLLANVWLVRIADATQYLHEDDSRDPEGEGGFGTGTIAFQFDEAGAGIAYGWYGSAQDPATYVPTGIVFGRVSR